MTRDCFRTLRAYRDRWAAAHPRLAFDVLSMGMSGDFALAIEEGATRIRIGTALFGKRQPWTWSGIMLRAMQGGITLAVRAQPGAKKTTIVGIYGEGAAAQLKIAVQAPPIEGRANSALIAFLAKFFDIPKGSVELISGELSRSKVFLLRGVTLQQVQEILSSSNLTRMWRERRMQRVFRFRANAEIRMCFGKEHAAIAADHVRRRNRQAPAVIAIHKRNVDEYRPVVDAEILGYGVNKAELFRNGVADIAEHGKGQVRAGRT